SGHDISLALEIDAGVEIEEITSTNHRVTTTRSSPTRASVKLAADDSIANRDFVLRCQVAGQSIKPALVVHRDERGGYFTLMLIPPANLSDVPRRPLEMIFTLDTSGSMQGKPMEQSKNAMRYALRQMD